MSGLSQLISTGWSGLNAAAQALETVSNNTANVNTPGYNIESVKQSELPGFAGAPGDGAQVTSIQRAYNQFVFEQLVGAGSANQAAQVAQENAQNLSAIFPVASGGAGGLGASLTSFFAAVNGITQDPTSLPDRQTFLSQANALASNFNSVGGQIAANLSSLDQQLSDAVTQVNTLSVQIATLNGQIAAQTASSSTGPPAALMDSRDNLVQQLGQELGVTVVTGPDNSVNVFTTGGMALVDGNSATNLIASSGSYGGGGLSIVYQPSGQDITASLSGGTIGGVITSQAQAVSAQNSVGALAAALSAAVNIRQTFGLDLNGALGGNIFSVAGPSVLAAASNTGGGSLNAAITSANAFVPGNFIVTKTAGGYQATNVATGQVSALGAGPNLSFDGMSIAVSGTINTGDSFELGPTAIAAQTLKVTATDPSTVAAASPYVATPGTNLGNVTASAFGAAAGGSLAAGAAIVPATYFGQNLTVKFTSATTFNVLTAGNAVVASGSFSAATGAQIAIDYPASAPAGEVTTATLSPGTVAIGDSFTLSPGGINSNGNALAMAGLSSQNLVSGQTLTSAYGTLVGQVGSAGETASFTAQATQGVLSQVQSVQQSISGVNLDEQAANLVSFQQAYQASAQVIASAQALFQSLLAAVKAA